ncbi:protein Spindly-like [Ornithodoros turicata]|uniref:protein Spindly-like n=1 Tax=Ornithodoros turicata TaxID=34597 RepID=UPI0031394756
MTSDWTQRQTKELHNLQKMELEYNREMEAVANIRKDTELLERDGTAAECALKLWEERLQELEHSVLQPQDHQHALLQLRNKVVEKQMELERIGKAQVEATKVLEKTVLQHRGLLKKLETSGTGSSCQQKRRMTASRIRHLEREVSAAIKTLASKDAQLSKLTEDLHEIKRTMEEREEHKLELAQEKNRIETDINNKKRERCKAILLLSIYQQRSRHRNGRAPDQDETRIASIMQHFDDVERVLKKLMEKCPQSEREAETVLDFISVRREFSK